MIKFVQGRIDSVFVAWLRILMAVTIPEESVTKEVALLGWCSFTPRETACSSKKCERRRGSLCSSALT